MALAQQPHGSPPWTMPPFPEHLMIPAEISDFIHKCLTVDPSRRPTAEELLRHRSLSTAAAAVAVEVAAETSMQRSASLGISDPGSAQSPSLTSPAQFGAADPFSASVDYEAMSSSTLQVQLGDKTAGMPFSPQAPTMRVALCAFTSAVASAGDVPSPPRARTTNAATRISGPNPSPENRGRSASAASMGSVGLLPGPALRSSDDESPHKPTSTEGSSPFDNISVGGSPRLTALANAPSTSQVVSQGIALAAGAVRRRSVVAGARSRSGRHSLATGNYAAARRHQVDPEQASAYLAEVAGREIVSSAPSQTNPQSPSESVAMSRDPALMSPEDAEYDFADLCDAAK